MWLNLYLEKIYYSQDFDWLVKSVVGLQTVNGVAFPADYRAAKSAVIATPVGTTQVIQVLSRPDEYDEKSTIFQGAVGQPIYVYGDHDLREFLFLPAPNQVYTWDLKYYYIPPLPDWTDAGTDSDTVKWGMPTSILVDHIKSRAFEYNDDDRQQTSKQEVMGELAQSKMNNHDRRAGPSRLPLGKRFIRRFK
jgi:hypothetical protein